MKDLKLMEIDTNKLDKIRKEAFEQVKSSSLFDDFIEIYEVTDEEIFNNVSKFIKVMEDKKVCKMCPGLSKCPKATQGIELSLIIDPDTDLISHEYVRCQHQKYKDDLDAKFIVRSFEDWFLTYTTKELFDNPDYINARFNIVSYLADNYNKHGIFLNGTRFGGKTFILALFAKQFAEENYGDVAFVDAPSYLKKLNDLNFVKKDEFEFKLSELMNVDLLVLDDFGNEYKNEFIRDTIVFPLLNERS